MILVWVDLDPLIQVWNKPLSELQRKRLQRGAPTAFPNQGIILVCIPAPKPTWTPLWDAVCTLHCPHLLHGSSTAHGGICGLVSLSCSSFQNLLTLYNAENHSGSLGFFLI